MNTIDGFRRRTFLKSAAAGAVIALNSKESSAQSAKRGKKIKVGAMAVGDFSFWPYSWGDILSSNEPVNRGKLETGILNMEISHVWDINPDVARSFAEKVGAEPVARYDEMLGQVDAVACGGYYETPWQHILLKPYIEAGIPVHVSRPFAYSLRDIDTLLDSAARHNTPIIATDVYEHLFAVRTMKAKLPSLGQLYSVQGTCLTGEFPARFHTQFMLPAIFGYDVDSVAVMTDDPNTSTYLSETFLYKGNDNMKPFTATSAMTPSGDLYSITVTGENGSLTSNLPQFADWQDDLMTHHLPMLVDMQRTFEGHNYEPYDIVRKKTELFLTGFYSASEKKGAPVKVGTVPVDWRARPAKPDALAAIGLK